MVCSLAKHGCKELFCTSIASHIKRYCQYLEFSGLMAIGKTPTGITEEDDRALVADFAVSYNLCSLVVTVVNVT